MKKNLLGAIVIFFVTLAFLLVIDDISKSKTTEGKTVKAYDADQQPIMVINEQE
ncbi:MAG TPA: hypothetical protein VKZ98_08625 [Aquaticitalea sp.]|nr:hypothetical protein [Aquaticitalea sp.]